MSRQKLFNMIKSRGTSEVGRNPFDLSNRHVYTQKAGKITPVKCVHTVPKDFFNCQMDEFSQNNIPMNTAAFLSGIKELSAYFVPYNTIWHNFNQYIATREDPDSVILQQKGISYEPRFNLYSLYNAGFNMVVAYTYLEYVLYVLSFQEFFLDTYDALPSTGAEVTWYAQMKEKYGDKLTVQNYIDDIDAYRNEKDIEKYYSFPKSFNDYFEEAKKTFLDDDFTKLDDLDFFSSEFATSVLSAELDLSCYEKTEGLDVNNMDMWCDKFGVPRWNDWLQKLDMFGYGNLYPLFHTFDVKSQSLIDSFNNYILYSDSPETHVSSLVRNFETFYFTYINDVYNVLDEVSAGRYVQVYPLFAYNKIFYDMFRNTYYDLDYNVRNYNVDNLDCSSLAGSIVNLANLPYRFYSLETHQWKKDMFTGVLPDNQLGDVSNVSVTLGTVSAALTGSPAGSLEDVVVGDGNTWGVTSTWKSDGSSRIYNNGQPIKSNNQVENGGLLIEDTTGSNPLSIRTPHKHSLEGSLSLNKGDMAVSINTGSSGAFDVLALKRAEAIQQYRQDLMRAGNRTRDIFKTIFGSNPKSEMDESPYFVEAVNNPLNVNPIVATADTGQENNGRLGDIAARLTISGSSLSFKFSTEDFGCLIFLSYIVPEAMYNSYRLDPNLSCLDPEAHGLPYFQNLGLQPVIGEYLNNLKSQAFSNSVKGFAPPYLEKKTDIDLAHGNLVDMSFSDEDGNVDIYQGSLSHWVVARTDMQNADAVTLRNFYIDPRILDNIFEFSAGVDYETDHVITYSSIKIDSVRAFSEVGLPRFV